MLGAALLYATLAAMPQPWFKESNERAGIPSIRHGEGVNAVDVNGDGFPDLFLPCVRGKGRLLVSDGRGVFTDVTESAGVTGAGGVGAGIGDLDGDGRPDILVARGAAPYAAPNLLYLQKPDGRFVESPLEEGTAPRMSGLSVVLADFDGDGRLDAFLPGWVEDTLYLNRGSASFKAATTGAGLESHGRGWTALASDFDGDGRPDLLVNRGGYDRPEISAYYRNLGGGLFGDATKTAGLAGLPWSLGSVAADFDGDGDFDLYVGGYAGPGRLYRNDGQGRFTDVTPGSGLDAVKSVGTAAGLIDGDLLPDLVVAGFAGPVRIYRNLGSMRFEEVGRAAGMKPFDKNEGIALADLDEDGDLDLYVSNAEGLNTLYLNGLDDPRYLKVRLAPGPALYLGAVARLYREGKFLAAQELGGPSGLGQGPQEFFFRVPDGGPYELKISLPGGKVVERTGLSPGLLTLP